MSRRVRIFEDEIIAKRVFTQLKRASKSTFNYKNNYQKKAYEGSNEVVVKITGNSKNFEGVKAHINYITRKNELEIKVDESESYKGKQEINEFKEIIKNEGSEIPSQNESTGKEKREMMHMVFSMRNKKSINKDKLMKAAMQTVKQKYPNNLSAFVYHGDTNNPHIHTIIKIKDEQGKRLDIRKKDLAELRINFAKELNKLGIEATATIKRNYDEEERKSHHYEVLEHGAAKYEFSKDENAQDSYFVKYKTKSGESIIWSKDLERVVQENNVKVGEFARFKIVGKVPVTISVKQTVNGQMVIYEKEAHKSVWDCSVKGREKDLIDPPVKTPVRFSFKKVGSILAEFKKFKARKLKSKSFDKEKTKSSEHER
ncbi:MAG: MobP1 family relaxase [Sulfurimonas sp.]|jgi:hypothetical protein|uniref:MobP1 family relaxase n=1 Tax=Sulfurimonas sp. TaxID=2022749 RepID=UPI0035643D2E